MPASNLYIGLMSGTSLDGVDGVLADFAGRAHPHPAGRLHALPGRPARELMALQAASENELEREALAANALARCYADCVRQLLPHAGTGARGGRAWPDHPPPPGTGFYAPDQQSRPAGRADRHRRDRRLPQRATSPPAARARRWCRPSTRPASASRNSRVVVNIGGIGNISVLHGDGRVSGFDTGPGNVLMDLWIARHTGKPYDEDGAWAAAGRVDERLLESCWTSPISASRRPRARDATCSMRNGWTPSWPSVPGALAPADVQATLTRLTAVSIARAIQDATAGSRPMRCTCAAAAPTTACCCAIWRQALGGDIPVASTDELGVAPNRVEALAFAWLGYRFMRRQPGNLPAVTGAAGCGCWARCTPRDHFAGRKKSRPAMPRRLFA
jgi:anhydro-N-acetylmuramic acid kinase